jgi:hypothetical protein
VRECNRLSRQTRPACLVRTQNGASLTRPKDGLHGMVRREAPQLVFLKNKKVFPDFPLPTRTSSSRYVVYHSASCGDVGKLICTWPINRVRCAGSSGHGPSTASQFRNVLLHMSHQQCQICKVICTSPHKPCQICKGICTWGVHCIILLLLGTHRKLAESMTNLIPGLIASNGTPMWEACPNPHNQRYISHVLARNTATFRLERL